MIEIKITIQQIPHDDRDACSVAIERNRKAATSVEIYHQDALSFAMKTMLEQIAKTCEKTVYLDSNASVEMHDAFTKSLGIEPITKNIPRKRNGR